MPKPGATVGERLSGTRFLLLDRLKNRKQQILRQALDRSHKIARVAASTDKVPTTRVFIHTPRTGSLTPEGGRAFGSDSCAGTYVEATARIRSRDRLCTHKWRVRWFRYSGQKGGLVRNRFVKATCHAALPHRKERGGL